MITSSREADFTAKQEGKRVEGKNPNKGSSSSSSPTPWSRFKDPRIVRVSRAFGGKDRHSKVCTLRGLRDRRVRLSVPTAIQLYDLQDRLGLNQPSKVVDWLLNVAKHEIDELPPLPILPGTFSQNHFSVPPNQGLVTSHSHKEGLKTNIVSVDWDDPFGLPRSNFWNSDKPKEADVKEENWNQRSGEEGERQGVSASSTSNFFPRSSFSSSPGLHNNAIHPHNFFPRWDPSIFSFPHIEDQQNFNIGAPMPSTLSIPSGPQFLLCPPAAAQSNFPPSPVEFDPKQLNQLQMLSSSNSQNPSTSLVPTLQSIAQSMKPLHYLSMAPKLLPSQTGSENRSDNNEFPPK